MVKYYNEDGSLNQETTYRRGDKEGQQNKYRQNGKMFATFEYKDGSPVSGMCHHTDGTKTPLTNAELTNWKNGLKIECK
jgi:hypothetical protein